MGQEGGGGWEEGGLPRALWATDLWQGSDPLPLHFWQEKPSYASRERHSLLGGENNRDQREGTRRLASAKETAGTSIVV